MRTLADLPLRTLPPLWLGMVLAISFLETPLKFRAPGMTLELGLGIGRLVFHALNAVELVFGAVLVVAIATNVTDTRVAVMLAIGVAVLALLVQVCVLRPALDARLDARLAGEAVSSSWHHLAYIAAEGAKVIALATAAVLVAVGHD